MHVCESSNTHAPCSLLERWFLTVKDKSELVWYYACSSSSRYEHLQSPCSHFPSMFTVSLLPDFCSVSWSERAFENDTQPLLTAWINDIASDFIEFLIVDLLQVRVPIYCAFLAKLISERSTRWMYTQIAGTTF